ncbi:guanine deaminase [Dendrothele bispora CBS 962.96]|uniref:Guanine deaminase n=1 Tax=Dendrothele bispora (strain CBS 962.96) TaxID=1314807 RepID=A0A4S8LA40_DENBC|nr:guanine deaminase [Dendrothele bispora CBS 962.96]
MSSSTYTVYYGSLVTPKTLTSYDASLHALVAVNSHGVIDWVVYDVQDSLVQTTLLEKGCPDAEVVELKDGQFMMPGFVDTHTHAPQLPNIGSGYQYELLEWLKQVTFPMEAKFSNVEFARKTYSSVVHRIINQGTTTCCYYGTLHLDATKELANIVHSLGQRAFVGKCNMDRNSETYYVEPSWQSSVTDTRALISHIQNLESGSSGIPLVKPILTPRFAISCSDQLLSSLGELAKSNPSLHIQTHISENLSEIQYTRDLFPKCKSYADVYDSFGLLRDNTVLAHAVHLSKEEIELVANRKAGISHCPTSNFNLNSGVAPIGKYLDRGIKVGLGTDVSGGYFPSILNSVRNASIASKIIAMQNRGQNDNQGGRGGFANDQLSIATLLYLATLGGAEVCAIDQEVGSLVPGKSFDAIVADVRDTAGNPALWSIDAETHDLTGKDALEGMLQRFLFCGDDRNISDVFVQGRRIGGKSN